MPPSGPWVVTKPVRLQEVLPLLGSLAEFLFAGVAHLASVPAYAGQPC